MELDKINNNSTLPTTAVFPRKIILHQKYKLQQTAAHARMSFVISTADTLPLQLILHTLRITQDICLASQNWIIFEKASIAINLFSGI